VGWGLDGGAPFACNDIAAILPDAGCVPACTDGGPSQCQLGAPCAPNVTGVNDNCAPAGLFCSELSETCAVPSESFYCTEGGASCRDGPDRDHLGQYLRNANVALECIQPTNIDAPVCSQLCQSTTDCVNPRETCCTDCVPRVCITNEDGCSDVFRACDAQGSGDGRCESDAPFGNLCVQANVDGGGPGSACDDLANRENPAFCDVADQCWFGVCVPVCNPSGDPVCPDERQFCLPVHSSSYGVCLTICALWASGGCPSIDGGVVQVCSLSLAVEANVVVDSVTVCVAQQADPAPIGGRCIPADGVDTLVSYPSPCVAGAICLNDVASNDWTCRQLCALGGRGGPPCPSGSTCKPISVGPGIATPSLGVCSPPDGG
jgi:hypothetical protein